MLFTLQITYDLLLLFYVIESPMWYILVSHHVVSGVQCITHRFHIATITSSSGFNVLASHHIIAISSKQDILVSLLRLARSPTSIY